MKTRNGKCLWFTDLGFAIAKAHGKIVACHGEGPQVSEFCCTEAFLHYSDLRHSEGRETEYNLSQFLPQFFVKT